MGRPGEEEGQRKTIKDFRRQNGKTEFHQNLVICLLLQEREEIPRVLAGCIGTGEPTVPQQRESSAV